MEKKIESGGRTFLFLVILSLVLIFADKRGFLKKFRSFFQWPILAIEQKIYSFKCAFSPKRNFQKEVESLQSEIRRLAFEQHQLAVCLEENEKMRRLLGAPLSPKWKFLPAKVFSVEEKMKIDKGEKEGVKQGMIVVFENILVGKIEKTEEKWSLVKLPISPEIKIPVIVRRPGKVGIQARGLLVSQPTGLILERVIQGESIKKGDLVATAGDEDWPTDLLIGEIDEVLPKTTEIYQKARLKPLIDYFNLREVFIVINWK